MDRRKFLGGLFKSVGAAVAVGAAVMAPEIKVEKVQKIEVMSMDQFMTLANYALQQAHMQTMRGF